MLPGVKRRVKLLANLNKNGFEEVERKRPIKEGTRTNKRAKFPELLKILCAERDAIEYATSDLRKSVKSPSSSVNIIKVNSKVPCCAIHFWSDNHSTVDCRTFKGLSVENKFDVLKERSVCFGH